MADFMNKYYTPTKYKIFLSITAVINAFWFFLCVVLFYNKYHPLTKFEPPTLLGLSITFGIIFSAAMIFFTIANRPKIVLILTSVVTLSSAYEIIKQFSGMITERKNVTGGYYDEIISMIGDLLDKPSYLSSIILGSSLDVLEVYNNYSSSFFYVAIIVEAVLLLIGLSSIIFALLAIKKTESNISYN